MRSETLSLRIISNMPFSDWPQVFGDNKIKPAIPDRIMHHCDIIEPGTDAFHDQ
jgi:DNA replication protein DnaC